MLQIQKKLKEYNWYHKKLRENVKKEWNTTHKKNEKHLKYQQETRIKHDLRHYITEEATLNKWNFEQVIFTQFVEPMNHSSLEHRSTGRY